MRIKPTRANCRARRLVGHAPSNLARANAKEGLLPAGVGGDLACLAAARKRLLPSVCRLSRPWRRVSRLSVYAKLEHRRATTGRVADVRWALQPDGRRANTGR